MSATITIRDIPEETHRELKSRAALNGQSLQEYLRAHLVKLTSKPDMKTLMAQIEERAQRTDTRFSREKILEYLDEAKQ